MMESGRAKYVIDNCIFFRIMTLKYNFHIVFSAFFWLDQNLMKTWKTIIHLIILNVCSFPANIHLDEDVLIKTNMFALALRLQKTSSRHLQDVFKTYYQVKLFLLTRLWEAFNTFLRRSFLKTVIYSRGICLGNTTSDKFMVIVQNLKDIKIYQVLVFHFSTPFRGCLERHI